MWDVRTLVGNKKLQLYFVKATPHNLWVFCWPEKIVDVEKIIIFTLKRIIIQYSLQSCLALVTPLLVLLLFFSTNYCSSTTAARRAAARCGPFLYL